MSDIIITSELLETKIREGLTSVDFVKAVDESSGCGAKFEIEIVSSDFKGKPLLAQHRMIHKILEVERKSIHALTLKTKAPSLSSTSSSAPVESTPVVITDVTAESKSHSHGECQGHTAGNGFHPSVCFLPFTQTFQVTTTLTNTTPFILTKSMLTAHMYTNTDMKTTFLCNLLMPPLSSTVIPRTTLTTAHTITIRKTTITIAPTHTLARAAVDISLIVGFGCYCLSVYK
jgi:stress-induced morphogen